MTIQLNKVIPDFLEKEKVDRSKIWNHEVRIQKGERVQIIAPSGSGKTSLVHFLYGLRHDYKGQILINEKNIHGWNAESFAGIRSNSLSIIFQDLRLFPDHSVLENIQVKKSLYPFEQAASIEEMAGRLGIANKLGKLARTCSYGEQQRIAIIRSLQQPFDFLLMDEPFSHLDENNRGIAMQLIEEEATKRKAGIILADLKRITQFNADKLMEL